MTQFPTERELVLVKSLRASRASVWRCWTDPELVRLWFAPAPYSVKSAELDVRAGGVSVITMQSPEGQLTPGGGVYLEVVEGRKLVFTDAFSSGWEPKDGAPFMVASVTLEDEGDGTLYTARARHWSEEAARQHEKMGFHDGWGLCATQLETLAQSLDSRQA